MPLKRINPDEVKITYKHGEDAVAQLHMAVRRLKPQLGEVLVVHGVPGHIDPQVIFEKFKASGALPDGAHLLLVPEHMTIEQLTDDYFESIGYQKIEGWEEEQDE